MSDLFSGQGPSRSILDEVQQLFLVFVVFFNNDR